MTLVCRACVLGGCKTHPGDTAGYRPKWNGEPCEAELVTLLVGEPDRYTPLYWAREHVGTERDAVRVTYGGTTFYLDNADGSGWSKVCSGGSPRTPHRNLWGSEVP